MANLIRLFIAGMCVVIAACGQTTEPAQAHAERALEFVHQGDLKTAAEELRKAVALSPNDPRLLTSLGGVLGMQGDAQHANFYLTKAVELDPQNPALRRNLAANQWQLGKLAEARANLEGLIRNDGEDKSAIYLLGMVSESQKDYARSATLLESLPGVLEERPQGWVALASSYYHTGRAEKAKTALQNLLRPPQNAVVTFAGGQTAMEANDYATAEALFVSIRSTYTDAPAVELQIALAQCRDGRRADCKNTLSESIKTGGAHVDSYILLCRVLADDGATVRALDVAAQAAETFPDSYKIFSTKAWLEEKLLYYSKAVESSETAVKLHKSPETMRDLAAARWRAGMRKQAVSDFEQILNQYPRDAGTREAYGTLLLDEGSVEARRRGIELLKQAAALDNASSEAFYQLGNVELEDGRPEQALQYLHQAAKQDSEDSRVHYALSRAYRRLGRSGEAESELETYKKLKGPNQ